MKKFKITKEQILEIASWVNRQDLVKLREWFQQAFESELEVGKWYTPLNQYEGIALVCVKNPNDTDNFGYGFDWLGNWTDKGYTVSEEQKTRLATKEEVETALIAEAKRRGLDRQGISIKCLELLNVQLSHKNDFACFRYSDNGIYYNGIKVYKNGKWAEIISKPIELTLEQIAEKFNVNVEQLKIKK